MCQVLLGGTENPRKLIATSLTVIKKKHTHSLQNESDLWIFLAVTVEGKIYACGEATNGRLGLGLSSGTIPIPRQITALSNYVVKKVAVHSGGRHAMALTVDGKVFSWGEGDDGKLGHFSRMCVFQASCRIFRNTLFFV